MSLLRTRQEPYGEGTTVPARICGSDMQYVICDLAPRVGGIGGPQAARFGSQSSSEETQRSNEFAPHEAGAIWRGYDSAR
jgi:hypothetical protein